MELRKFIISLVSRFDGRGFRDANKQAQKLAKTADKVSKSFDKAAKAERRAANAAVKSFDRVTKSLKTMTRSEILAAAKLQDLKEKTKKSTQAIDRFKRSIKRTNREIEGIKTQKAAARLDKLKSAASGVGSILRGVGAGLATFGAIGVGVAAGVLKVGVSFEQLRARLKTVEGDAAGAKRAFTLIQDFAKTTPFEIDNLTQGFTQLRVRGVKPTTDVLTGLGDLTSAFGLTFTDVTDAIGAAARGELDPIEKFGISAKIAGDQIKLSFKGQTIEVKRSAAAVTDALVAFGKMEGIQGAMADQSSTAGGMISNLKDAFSTLLDEISQLGVLDEFKGLLGDISGAAGTDGLAGIVAKGLVNALKSLREWMANVSEEDIREFLEGVVSLAKSLAEALGLVIRAMKAIVDASNDAGTGVRNLALIVGALTVALTGPAGIVLALGMVGVAMGSMAESAVRSRRVMSTVNDAILADLKSQVAELKAVNDSADALFAKIAAGDKQFKEDREELRGKQRAKVKGVTGPLGAGLTKDIADEDIGLVSEQIARGGKDREAGFQSALTSEGRQILEGVESAGRAQVDAVEKRARRDARRRGATDEAIERSAANARAAAQVKVRGTRTKALAEANVAFQETGSVEQALGAASKKIRGKKRGGGGAKGKTFFDFSKKAKAAALSQGEEFAALELQRLIATGTLFEEAQTKARAAGEQRADELEKRFKETGKIFTRGDSILDVLGLKGPGSVLEGRPAPQSLIISISPEFNFIKNFTQSIGEITGAKALEEVSGQAGQAAVEAGLAPSEKAARTFWMMMFNLQTERLLKLDGGGTLPQGPEQG